MPVKYGTALANTEELFRSSPLTRYHFTNMNTIKSTNQQVTDETFSSRTTNNYFRGRISCRYEGGRVRIRVPRRQECLTRRAIIAALREAELAEWEASGGDFLAGMHQPF